MSESILLYSIGGISAISHVILYSESRFKPPSFSDVSWIITLYDIIVYTEFPNSQGCPSPILQYTEKLPVLESSGNAEKDIVATALFPAPEREIVAGPAPFS